MKQVLRTILLAGTLLGLGIAQAQEVTELARHPGQTLTFDINFTGTDAPKIKTIRILLVRQTETPPNQSGFNVTSQGGDFSADSTGVFHASVKISEGTPTGDYFLRVDATAGENAGSAMYKAGTDFQLHTFHIDNPATFTPAKIDVKEVH